MGKTTLILIIFAILIIGAGVFFALRPIPSPNNSQQILLEVEKVNNEATNNTLTANDLTALNSLTQNDPTATKYMEELNWMVAHNQTLHTQHITTFLTQYEGTGIDSPCVPQELWHVSAAIQYNDSNFANKELQQVTADYNGWVNNVGQKKAQYPQFYSHSDETKKEVDDAINLLNQGNYGNQTVTLLNQIGETGVC